MQSDSNLFLFKLCLQTKIIFSTQVCNLCAFSPQKKGRQIGLAYMENPGVLNGMYIRFVSFANRTTWRIIPVSKWFVTPIYKPFGPFGRGITLLRALTNHGYSPLTNWDDPPSISPHPIFDHTVTTCQQVIYTCVKGKPLISGLYRLVLSVINYKWTRMNCQFHIFVILAIWPGSTGQPLHVCTCEAERLRRFGQPSLLQGVKHGEVNQHP